MKMETYIDQLSKLGVVASAETPVQTGELRLLFTKFNQESLPAAVKSVERVFNGTLRCIYARIDSEAPKILLDTDQGDVEFTTFRSIDEETGEDSLNLHFAVPANWDSHGPLGALRRSMSDMGMRYHGRSKSKREHLWSGPWKELFPDRR